MSRAIRLMVSTLATTAAAAALLVTGSATASADEGCTHQYSYNFTRVTVHCAKDTGKDEFRAVAVCPNVTQKGPWVATGGDRVSVATCANPMIVWNVDLRNV